MLRLVAANPPEGEAAGEILGINTSTLSSSTVRTSFERVWSPVKPSKEEFVSATSGYVNQLYLAYCNEEIDPKLLGALKLIPDTYLVPLLLREIHDASYDEIANVLEVPKGTVMSRLSRGRALLRKRFFAEADGHQSIEDNGNPKNGSRGSFDEMH